MDREGNKTVQCLDGTTFGIRAGTWAIKELQSKLECKGILELLGKYANTNVDVNALILAFMEMANDYTYHARKGEIIKERDASTLIDKVGGPVQALQIINETFEHFLPKNSPAPQTEGIPELILE